MTKADFKYIKDKIHDYSEELTYLKNHNKFINSIPENAYKEDVKVIEQILLKIVSGLKNNEDYNNLRAFSSSTTAHFKSTSSQLSQYTKINRQQRAMNISRTDDQINKYIILAI